jgi:HK97 family phage major capsid protein
MLTTTKADVDRLNSGVDEVRTVTNDLQSRVRQLKSSTAGSMGERGNYTGKFHTPQEAKAFALLVMAAVSSAHDRLKDQHGRTMKALADLNVEPYWIDADGRKAMTGSSQAAGGALVTVEQSPTIIKLLQEYGVFRRNARVMPMGSGQTTVPKIDGLLTVYCPGEGGTITQTTPDVPLLGITPKTLCALTAYSMELEDDSLVALGELLADLFTRSFAYYEDLCGFLGDGTSTYFSFKGVTGSLLAVDATIGNIKSLVVGTGNAYSELVLGDFIKVQGTLPQFPGVNPKWYEHRYFYHAVFVALALAAGGTPASEVIMGAGQRQKLQLGDPVEFTQVMPKVEANSQICSIYGDLMMGAVLGARGGLEFATSDQRYFEQGLIAVRGRDRVAINAHGVGDTTNAGPICALIMAAS